MDDITSFIRNMGAVYNNIGKNFPAIEKEIKDENDEALLLISYFLYQDENEEALNDEAGLSHELNENQKNFFNSIEKTQGLLEEDDRLSKTIVEGVNRINSIMGAIDEIRLLADQIKVYSLNAIIISSKHGSAGRAFGEISKNIIKLSDNSNQQAEQMSTLGTKLFEEFRKFKQRILEINSGQKDKFTEIRTKVIEAYEKLNSTFKVFSFLVKDLIDRVDTTKKVIFEIMMLLQKEDIIRQHTEHITESIEEMIKESDTFLKALEEEENSVYGAADTGEVAQATTNGNNEKLDKQFLDLLTFEENILELVISQIDTVRNEIESTNKDVSDHLLDMKRRIVNIQDDRDHIIGFLTGGEAGSARFPITALDNSFNEYLAFMEYYVDEFGTSLKEKRGVAESNLRISTTIENLEELFFEAKNISRTFNSINFLAKIELEKNSDVFKGSNMFSINNVESIASNISETVNNCLVSFSDIKQDLFGSIEIFSANISEQDDEYRQVKDKIATVSTKLNASKNIIKDNINSLEKYARNLVTLIDATVEDVNSVDILFNELDGIRGTMRSIQENISKKRKEFLTNLNITEWQVASEKYRSIISRYSIQKERLIANQVLSGLDEEVGAESGELTLF